MLRRLTLKTTLGSMRVYHSDAKRENDFPLIYKVSWMIKYIFEFNKLQNNIYILTSSRNLNEQLITVCMTRWCLCVMCTVMLYRYTTRKMWLIRCKWVKNLKRCMVTSSSGVCCIVLCNMLYLDRWGWEFSRNWSYIPLGWMTRS